jgi:hypothetical protein
MIVRPYIGSLFLSLLLVSVSSMALAKSHDSHENENMALIYGDASERYPIVGTGGIRVSGGHHGIFASNMKSSSIEIDGSGIAAQRYAPSNESSDFTASPNCAYFVSHACVCTLPTASGVAGQEVVVCNTSGGATIFYKSFNGELLPGGTPSGQITNSVAGRVDKFISDGTTWYRE